MGVNIAGMRNRYPKWQHVDVGPSDYAELSDSVTLQAHTFHPQSGPSNTFIDFQASDIVTAKGKWDTTNAHTYELQQALLIQVLLNTDSEHWSALWLCKLFRQHMVVSFEGLGCLTVGFVRIRTGFWANRFFRIPPWILKSTRLWTRPGDEFEMFVGSSPGSLAFGFCWTQTEVSTSTCCSLRRRR